MGRSPYAAAGHGPSCVDELQCSDKLVRQGHTVGKSLALLPLLWTLPATRLGTLAVAGDSCGHAVGRCLYVAAGDGPPARFASQLGPCGEWLALCKGLGLGCRCLLHVLSVHSNFKAAPSHVQLCNRRCG